MTATVLRDSLEQVPGVGRTAGRQGGEAFSMRSWAVAWPPGEFLRLRLRTRCHPPPQPMPLPPPPLDRRWTRAAGSMLTLSPRRLPLYARPQRSALSTQPALGRSRCLTLALAMLDAGCRGRAIDSAQSIGQPFGNPCIAQGRRRFDGDTPAKPGIRGASRKGGPGLGLRRIQASACPPPWSM